MVAGQLTADVAECTTLITGQDLPLQYNGDLPLCFGRWLQIGAQFTGETQLIEPPLLRNEDIGGRRSLGIEVAPLDEPTQTQLLGHAVHGSGDVCLAAAHAVAVLVTRAPAIWHSLPPEVGVTYFAAFAVTARAEGDASTKDVWALSGPVERGMHVASGKNELVAG